MSSRWRSAAVPLLALHLAACGGADGLSSETVARNWQATHCEYVDPSGQAATVDLVADEGWTVWLHLNDTGAFRYLTTPPGGMETWVDGTWTTSGGSLVLHAAGGTVTWEFEAKVSEGSLVLQGANAEYDFDGDTVPEPATWNLRLRP